MDDDKKPVFALDWIKNLVPFRQKTGNLQARVRQRSRYYELIAFAWVLPLIGLAMFPADPTGLDSGFPWVIAGPLVFAARYGSGWGLSCGLLTGGFFLIPFPAYTALSGDYLVLALGTLFMSVVVGDTSAAWRRKSQKADAENQYLQHRLKEFSADYHVLKVSHGLLEEHLAGQRLSLREALQQLKPMLNSSFNDIRAGSEMLAVFSQFCSIQVAGLYTMIDDKNVKPEAVAKHGKMAELPLFDPLLRAAIETHEVASIKLDSLAEQHLQSGLLAVVPLAGADGHLHGVLAIKDMHFMAFQQQNLNLLALLGYYVGNQLSRIHGAVQSQAGFFFSELDTVLRFAQAHSTESAVFCLIFSDHKDSARIAEFVSSTIRSLDASLLLLDDNKTPVLSLLLPLMTETKSIGFMQRVNDAVKEEFCVSLDEALQSSALYRIDSASSRASFMEHLKHAAGAETIEQALQESVATVEQYNAA
ncbi:GAF domain-containing protein [bacterium]|nr:GAF domain-containing protein [bacterium]